MQKFGIYVHWPFCAKKCPYCDFNSYEIYMITEERRMERKHHKRNSKL